MSLRLFGLILAVGGILTCFLYSSEQPTDEIWLAKAGGNIMTQPAEVGSRSVYLLQQLQIAAIDADGSVTGPVPLAAPARHPLVGIASGVLAADRDGGYTFYSPALAQVWKRATATPSELRPVALPRNRLVVSGAPDVLFGLDGTTGEALWESHFEGTVVHVVPGDTIAVAYGYDDLKKPSWKLCAIDPDDGSIVWKHPDPVSDDAPVVYSGHFIFCDDTGRPVAVRQDTGERAYRHDGDGYRIGGITGNSLLLLAAGGTRMDCFDLPTGTSWSVTLPSPFLGALAVDDVLLFADGRSLRCIEAKTGNIRWQRDLGKTFDWFVHENALGITYKDNFLARRTSVTLFTPDRNRPLWTAMDSGRFYKPALTSRGDVLVCRSGNIRLMPRPEVTNVTEAAASETVTAARPTPFFAVSSVATPPAQALPAIPATPAAQVTPIASTASAALQAPASPPVHTPVQRPVSEPPAMPTPLPAPKPPAPLASPSGW